MIYFDNSATTLQKPASVAKAVYQALVSNEFGNPGRSCHRTALNALSSLFKTRAAVAELFNLQNPLHIALCQNATAALNLVIKSLLNKNDHIITTVFAHNSALRPLFQLEKEGAELSIIGMEVHKAVLRYEDIEPSIKKNTKAVLINHCSNVTGTVCNLDYIHTICKKHGLIMIADIAQSAGTLPLDVSKYSDSIFCFTGHKGLYGPQGTGGIIVNGAFDFKPVFSGGSGVHSFEKTHPAEIPDVFEAGTMNVPSFAGLAAGCAYIKKTGIENINTRLKNLHTLFLREVHKINGITLYANEEPDAGAIVSLNIRNLDSGEVSRLLDEKYGIATRPGAHCAPLVHRAYGTEAQGMVRFSFSAFNNEAEIETAIKTLYETARKK